MKSRSRLMLEKSVSAMLSAIEIYNKPDFKYREETFSVLCINAWELLLKAKILHLSGNKISALFVMEYKILSTGGKSKRKYPKTNRSGNPLSINLNESYRVIVEDYGVKIDKPVNDNLIAITEIRDNSIHFVNNDFYLSLKVQELGTAALQNYLHLVKEWFGDVLSGYNFYLMPISFFRDFHTAKGVVINTNEKKLLNYINSIEQQYDINEPIKNYNLTLSIDVKFQKAKSTTGVQVQVTNNPNASQIILLDEEIAEKYPWDYQILKTRLSKRYSDFKINSEYHLKRKELEKDSRFAHTRLLNPSNPKSGRKILYNPNIQKEFDKYYTKLIE